MSDLISYEATVQSRTKVTKQKQNGDEYDVVEVKYKSNGKPFTTSVLLSAKDMCAKLKALNCPVDVALVFEKKGKFNQLVDVLPKGESSKYRSAAKSSGGYSSKSSFNSEGMERGNALHCASRIVSALIHKGEVTESRASALLLSLAETILAKRSEPEKKEVKDDDDFTEVSESKENDDFGVDEELNDDISF